MPITFACPCGKTLQVKDEYAGRPARCPACGIVSTVGAIELPDEVIEPPPAPVPAAPIRANPVRKREESDRRSSDRSNDRDSDASAERKEPDRRPRRTALNDDYPRRRRPHPRPAVSSERVGLRVAYLLGGLTLAAFGLVVLVLGWMSAGQEGPRALVVGVCLVFCGLGATLQGIFGDFSRKEPAGSDWREGLPGDRS